MGLLTQCLPRTSAPRQVTPCNDDLVYPVHKLDNTKTFRSLLLAWTLSFNDVLDAERLRSSLARLLEIGDWKKLGGRLNLKSDGSLEIRVPRVFTVDRPPFSYSHEQINMAMEMYESTKDFPRSGDGVSFWPSPHSFQSLAAPLGAPATASDLYSRDIPQLSLHITTFANATLVAIRWPHTLIDIMGQQALLRAWSLVLQGRDLEVPRVLGAREDILPAIASASLQKHERYILKEKQLRGSSMIRFIGRFVWDMVHGATPETQTICLPGEVVATMRLRAQLDIATTAGGEKPAFISDGDVLTAWTIRAISTSLPRPRSMTALHVMNARFRIPALCEAPGVYLQNMVLPANTFLSAAEALKPLGAIALRNRQHLTDQATESQVLACLREQLQADEPSKLFYSDANALPVPYTNWAKADLLQAADFSAAVVRAGDARKSRRNPPGTPTFHHVSAMKQSRTTKLMVVILGKDHDNNYWLTLTLPPKAWEKIDESLEELRLLSLSSLDNDTRE